MEEVTIGGLKFHYIKSFRRAVVFGGLMQAEIFVVVVVVVVSRIVFILEGGHKKWFLQSTKYLELFRFLIFEGSGRFVWFITETSYFFH